MFYNNYICQKLGKIENLKIKRNKSVELKKNEVRLKVLAIGLNYVDTLMIKGDYQYKNKLPFVPGTEACGIIIEENCNDVKLLNRKVIIFSKSGCFSEEAVINSSKALYYFGLGLPAFAFIKVFSTFFFANNDTKTPFYISLISVIMNIFISLYYFKSIGFIIIPIATSISSWFNSLVLFIYLRNRKMFMFNSGFIINFFKIVIASIIMGIFFNYLIIIFQHQLIYEYHFKSFYLICSVILALCFYLLVSFFIKAFNYKDLHLKY